MLLIVGGERDAEALAAVESFGHDRAALLTAKDLSQPGWNLPFLRPSDHRIIVGGRAISADSITGVLVRRLAVYPQELIHVHEADREYVASEMTALLTWWLHELPMPVLNRPAAGVLCGPGWRPEQWRALAARLGHAVTASTRTGRDPEALPLGRTEVVTIGDAVAGEPNVALVDRTLALARAGNAPMLCAVFGEGDVFLRAHCMPGLTPDVLAALERYLRLPG